MLASKRCASPEEECSPLSNDLLSASSAPVKTMFRGTHMKTKTCPDCNGDGVVDKDTDDEHQCPTCGGLGFVPDDDDQEEVIKTSRDLPHRQGAAWTRQGA